MLASASGREVKAKGVTVQYNRSTCAIERWTLASIVTLSIPFSSVFYTHLFTL